MLAVLALVVTSVPNMFWTTAHAANKSGDAGTDTRVADGTTLDGWKEYFGESDSKFTTQYAGHVWTDKSVTTDATKFSYATELADSGDKIAFNGDDQNNFLVALSAMASSKSITGQDNKPTDTMIVLDMSSSMYKNSTDRIPGPVTQMIESVNETIKKLQELNVNNRVGVTVYYGGPDLNQAPKDSYQVWLPLDRYKHAKNQFLVAKTSSGKLASAGVNSNVKTESGKTVTTTTRATTVTAGTYMQQGILSALKQFMAAETKVPDNAAVNAGEARVPVMVLMSDGKPTAATNSYTQLDKAAIMGSNREDIRSANETDFLTQLTAAYAKEMMDAHYEEETPLLYTLSFGNGFSYTVMDPSGTLEKKNTEYESNPATVSGYWNKLVANNSLKLSYKVSKGQWDAATTTKTCTVSKTTVGGKAFPSSASQQYYVNKAFEAADADDLKDAFANIFTDISLQTHTYPTLVDGDENLDGYISFVDKIGEYMSVTDVKGVLLGEHWYSGKEFAKNLSKLGTTSNPTALGDELVWSIQQRLNLSDAATVRTLLSLAYQHGQLAYNSDGSYSNYVGWYSDKDGNYLGFWQEGVTTAPNNATHANKSYIYMGETDASHGVKDSDMMYTTVRVRHEIETGVESVSFAVPAALIPTVEYDVEYNENDILTSVKRGGADHPIRLVYEVALDDTINERTIRDVVDHHYIAHNTDANGYVNFYTNQYEVSGEVGYNKVNTYSYFRPSHQNENYYYQENEPVYTDQNGTVYKGEKGPNSDGVYYREITVYHNNNGTIKEENIYRQLSKAAPETAQPKGDGTWYIPKGNVHVNMDGYTIAKAANKTETLANANLPYVDVYKHNVNDPNHKFVIGDTLGNNGKVRIKPETGIKISKEIENAESETNMDEEFEFTIETDSTVGGTYDAVKVASDGKETETTVNFNSGKATVTLKHDESMYVLGLAAGLEFTITETEEADFVVSKVVMDGGTIPETVANGTLGDGYIADIEFTNVPRGEGALTIAKQVVHSLGTYYQIPDNKTFKVNVKLEGVAVNSGDEFEVNHSGDANLNKVTLDDDKAFSLTLKHGEQVEIKEIPEGTKATVTEENPGTGFTVTYKENGEAGDGVIESIQKAPTIDNITVVNTYNPESAKVKIDLNGTKTLKDEHGTTVPKENWGDLEFQFIIQKYVNVNGTWKWVDTETVDTADKTNDKVDFVDGGRELTFDKVGVYGYQVIEKNHGQTIDGITYDSTMHTFNVIVTDEEMDGKLEARVESSHGTGNSFTFVNDTWTNNQINFVNNNNRGKTSELIMIKKNLTNESGSTKVSLEGYQFELFTTDKEHKTIGDCVYTTPKTDASGETYVSLTYEWKEAGTYYYKLKEKATGINGMSDSEAEYNFKVKVTANDDGSVTSEIIGATEDTFETFQGAQAVTYNLATFTNVYKPDVATVTLDVKKKLEGRTLKEHDFDFTIEAVTENAPMPENTTVSNKADGLVEFGALTFDKVGTYEYKVKEVIPTENRLPGVTYDETVYDVVITVTDNNGKLAATVDVLTVPGTEMIFKNEYQPPEAELELKGTKKLDGRNLVSGMFAFTLEESDDKGTIKENGYHQKVTNDENGNLAFSKLTYDENGTHYYVISEEIPENTQGITYDETKYLVKVDVEYNAESGLFEVKEQITKLGEPTSEVPILFKNKYKADPTTAVIKGSKDLQGKNLTDGQFEFELYKANENWTVGDKLDTASNDDEGYFTFGTLTFENAGTYNYIIKEVIPEDAELKDGKYVLNGVTYDTKEVGVIITVTDDLAGNLQATQKYVEFADKETDVASIVFENRYEITGEAKVDIAGTKTLTGRELKEGEFTFVLTDVTDPNNPVEVERVTNDVQGKFAFNSLPYKAEHVGKEYTYMIKEVIPEGSEKLNGIIYDTKAYTVVVEVLDNNDGTLSVKTSVDGKEVDVVEVEFENEYDPGSAVAVIGGEKNLEGRNLKADEFEFSLIKGRKVVETVKNEADGTFAFTALTFDKVGTYEYTVVENNTKAEGITYDETEYEVVIEVSDKGGSLEAEVTVLNDGDAAELEFNNEYTPEESEKTDDSQTGGPDTGDHNNIGMYLVFLVGALFAIVGIIAYRRKR